MIYLVNMTNYLVILNLSQMVTLLQLCYKPVVIYYIVYHYIKKTMLIRLFINESLVIYVVHLNRYFIILL